jgi:hypothetical protein
MLREIVLVEELMAHGCKLYKQECRELTLIVLPLTVVVGLKSHVFLEGKMCWILILHNLKSSRAAADADWCINFA